MSSLHPDGSVERDARIVDSQVMARHSKTLASAQATLDKLTRASEELARENAQLRARMDQVESLVAQINERLDAVEACADVFADEPIPYELA
jgi:hypothetical protein